jgi:hypothetical protein
MAHEPIGQGLVSFVTVLVTIPSSVAKGANRRDQMKNKSHKPSKKQQEQLDDLLRKTVRERFGHPVAVVARLGLRYTDTKQGKPYIRMLLANNFTAFLCGWHKGAAKCSVSAEKADPKSYSMRVYFAREARKEKRGAKEAGR